jgi:hypothetical protein
MVGTNQDLKLNVERRGTYALIVMHYIQMTTCHCMQCMTISENFVYIAEGKFQTLAMYSLSREIITATAGASIQKTKTLLICNANNC